jgi:Icc-related predicted phosphoesterase
VFGHVREARGAAEVDELESAIRQAGSYTVRLTRDEKNDIDRSPAEIDGLFKHAIIETTTRWMELAKERLEPLGVPIYVSAGNDDELYVEDVLAQAEYVCWPEDEIVELPDGREMVSIGYSNITPFEWRRWRRVSRTPSAPSSTSTVLHIRRTSTRRPCSTRR